MSDTTNALNDVVSLLKAGENYYRESAESVKDPSVKSVFSEMAAVRSAAVKELSSKIEGLGGDPSGASWAEQAREFYTSAKSLLTDKTETLITALEEHEDRTLKQIREALGDVDNREAQTILSRHLDTFRSTHAKMKSLKHAKVD